MMEFASSVLLNESLPRSFSARWQRTKVRFENCAFERSQIYSIGLHFFFFCQHSALPYPSCASFRLPLKRITVKARGRLGQALVFWCAWYS